MLFRDILMSAAMGAGPLYSAEALALFARMTSQPDVTRKALIDDLIGDLKAAGIWDKCDAIHVLAAHDSQAALLNWKSGTYNCTASSSPVFTADRGYAGDGAGACLDTGAMPSALTNYTQNSAHLAAWARLDPAAGSQPIAGTAVGSNTWLFPKETGSVAGGRINDTLSMTAAVPTAIGLVGMNRSGATARQVYKNGSAIASDARTSASPSASNILYLRAAGFFSSNQVAFGCFGASLTDSQWSALYVAVQTYLQGVGAA